MAMLVQNPRVRNILVQPRSVVGWDGVLERDEIVLANLDQADTALGEAGSRLLGSIRVTQFWQAVLRRPPHSRPPFFAVFDEFQEFLNTGRDLAEFFERSRSYGVGLPVAPRTPATRSCAAIADGRWASRGRRSRRLVAASYGGLPEDTKAHARRAKPKPDELLEQLNETAVQVNAPEPRSSRRSPGTRWPTSRRWLALRRSNLAMSITSWRSTVACWRSGRPAARISGAALADAQA